MRHERPRRRRSTVGVGRLEPPFQDVQSPEAEMDFCAAAFGAVEQVRRPGPDGSPIHIAMRVNEAFLVVQAECPDVVVLMPAQNQFWGDRTARIVDPSGHVWTVASRIEEATEGQRADRWSDIREGRQEP